ncbi:MAG: hypothetical protein KatS3mg099_189 [Candidatus Parcubacteria bacterium]|nr:MAG: hypothetical protein KatS3mg099_189 [Candidatus Parcubacteria bacterium]
MAPVLAQSVSGDVHQPLEVVVRVTARTKKGVVDRKKAVLFFTPNELASGERTRVATVRMELPAEKVLGGDKVTFTATLRVGKALQRCMGRRRRRSSHRQGFLLLRGETKS